MYVCRFCLSHTLSLSLSLTLTLSVGPVVHVTQAYSAWSQNLNRRIFAALGAANSLATETLTNIRTVKVYTYTYICMHACMHACMCVVCKYLDVYTCI